MANVGKPGFDVDAYLRDAGPGRRIVQLNSSQVFFYQGDSADCVFYLHKGRAKISVLSSTGKEATIRLVAANNFFGEKAMAAEPGLRVTTATAVTACSALRIETRWVNSVRRRSAGKWERLSASEPQASFPHYLMRASLPHRKGVRFLMNSALSFT